MAVTLYYHPLSSYCWKVLIALYEHGTPFTPHLVDLSDPTARAEFVRISPFGKFPVIRDDATGRVVLESTPIIEHLALHHAGAAALLPAEARRAEPVRARDRFFDLYVHEPMQKIVTDKLRPEGRHDAHGVEAARATLGTAYAVLERELPESGWACGPEFTLADCAGAPPLFYADKVHPIGGHARVAAYLERLKARPSFARVLKEAGPYFAMFPG